MGNGRWLVGVAGLKLGVIGGISVDNGGCEAEIRRHWGD